MPPIDLTGVGGWFGAQNALRDIVAQTAARGAQERAQIESMMQLALKNRAQNVDEADFDLRRQTYDEAAPIREANLRNIGAGTGLTEAQTQRINTQDVRDIAEDSRKNQAAIALRILGGDIDEKSNEAQRRFQGRHYDLDRAQRGVIAAENDKTALAAANIRAADSGARPPNVSQARSWSFFGRMREALETMNGLEDKLSPKDLALVNNSPMNELLTSAALSPEGRRYVNAIAVFSEARLRDESGAVVTPFEMDKDRQMYARSVTDGVPEMMQKRVMRARTAAGVAGKAGPAYELITGRPFDYEAITDALAGRTPGVGGGGGQQAAPAQTKTLKYDPVTKTFGPGGD